MHAVLYLWKHHAAPAALAKARAHFWGIRLLFSARLCRICEATVVRLAARAAQAKALARFPGVRLLLSATLC